MPAIYCCGEFTRDGGLIAYGASLRAAFRLLAGSAEKILGGAAPSDPPVQQTTKFELLINLSAARALGVTIPPGILARADEVIE